MIAIVFAAAVALAAQCDLEAPSGQAGCTRAAVDALKINQVQAVGSHNSYKQAISPRQMALLRSADPKQADGLDYAHPPLSVQLDAGARQLEIDVLNDPDGGRYAAPLAMKMANDLPYDLTPLKAPGLKVMHVQDIDYRSSCPRFTDCLAQIRAWSKAHPDHLPLLILLNLKEGGLSVPGAVIAAPFDAKAMDAVDAEIASVFPAAELITPGGVQGRYATLREAAAAGAWPTLKTARGKVMFALDAPDEQVALYRGARKTLEGRVMFVNTAETSPAAAYITLNEPAAQSGRIQAAVRAGLIVRTRADADTIEARTNDQTRAQAAFASGAQYVSTDYMFPDPRRGPYQVRLPGDHVARRNPVAR
ncbi:MAG: phosphatidylinositol-specific phospholipase C1-like protein [Pseudomonadota bacterium]|mgnify:CR=1 FL=1|uniref:phosphatidylinositol-specific phospholipase C1-like protein n=1 Tax=Phenylobacterium sp. TaxID=1871053 RepID=UPI0025D8C009|nr:phosphatidylinositol-specific phospholipase C1-like protein [Phenylobacterium sp.]MBT9470480.1 phosphatidylinositol-specific phospholipase C1-like protein [Phenylobacterium sp.]